MINELYPEYKEMTFKSHKIASNVTIPLLTLGVKLVVIVFYQEIRYLALKEKLKIM